MKSTRKKWDGVENEMITGTKCFYLCKVVTVLIVDGVHALIQYDDDDQPKWVLKTLLEEVKR